MFFAIEDNSVRDDAMVYILSPTKLNKVFSTEKKYYIIPNCSDLPKKESLFTESGLLNVSQFLRKYYWLNCEEDELLHPIALYPPHLDERMSSQLACFALFGNVVDGLTTNVNKEIYLDYITIDKKFKSKMLAELNILGINNYSIYPDLDGLGKSINFEFNGEFSQAKFRDDLEDYFS